MTLIPKEDVFAEGSETISITLANAPYYRAPPATNVFLSDNEPIPPPLSLRLASPTNGVFDLTLGGAPTRLFNIETSSDFDVWQRLATLLTPTNTTHLLDLMPTNAPYLFSRARQQE